MRQDAPRRRASENIAHLRRRTTTIGQNPTVFPRNHLPAGNYFACLRLSPKQLPFVRNPFFTGRTNESNDGSKAAVRSRSVHFPRAEYLEHGKRPRDYPLRPVAPICEAETLTAPNHIHCSAHVKRWIEWEGRKFREFFPRGPAYASCLSAHPDFAGKSAISSPTAFFTRPRRPAQPISGQGALPRPTPLPTRETRGHAIARNCRDTGGRESWSVGAGYGFYWPHCCA